MRTLMAILSVLASSSLASANVTVSGTGKVKYTPDIAYVTIGFGSDATTGAEAWKKNGELVKKYFAVLKELGVAEKDMQTIGLSLHPRYVHRKDEEPRLVGYTAVYDLKVTVRKLDSVGRILDLAAECGANRNVGIQFACAEPEKLIDQARAAAVAEARKKAELYTRGAGATLGPVQSIQEGSVSPWRHVQFDMAAVKQAPGASLPIATGEQELSVTVTITYGLVHPLSTQS